MASTISSSDEFSVIGTSADFGISLEVSFIERKKDEQTLEQQAKVLEVPVVEGIYYLAYSDGASHKLDANEENRRSLREKVRSQEVRKVLVKADVPYKRRAIIGSVTFPSLCR